MVAASTATVEPMEEEKEEEENKEDVEEGSSTEVLVLSMHQCCRQLCLHFLGFRWWAQVTRWLGEGWLLAQGHRVEFPPCS